MIGSIPGKIKEKAALIDPNRYGRSDTSALGRWFWEIDKVLLLLVSVLIGIGLAFGFGAEPSGDDVRVVAVSGTVITAAFLPVIP